METSDYACDRAARNESLSSGTDEALAAMERSKQRAEGFRRHHEEQARLADKPVVLPTSRMSQVRNKLCVLEWRNEYGIS
jgi:hypothetical protein